jgi:methyltransferase (TIGR00027 family)
MDEGQPSSTARRAAMLRAAHQILDDPKILDDPIALRIIGPEGESWLRSNLDRLQEARFLRAFVVARSRYAEDELARAVQRGTRQYVILGAGLETFPYRNPHDESRLHVYEVDHPATQSWKRKRLLEAGISTPGSLTFAPIDFERQTLAEGLGRAGLRANEPTFFSLLGVMMYLTEAAVMETFGFVASMPSGSEIVFDCAVPDSSLSDGQRLARQARADRVAAVGEPWRTHLDPVSLARDLRQMGFSQIEDLGPEAANERYFKDRTDGLRLAGAAHLMKARV